MASSAFGVLPRELWTRVVVACRNPRDVGACLSCDADLADVGNDAFTRSAWILAHLDAETAVLAACRSGARVLQDVVTGLAAHGENAFRRHDLSLECETEACGDAPADAVRCPARDGWTQDERRRRCVIRLLTFSSCVPASSNGGGVEVDTFDISTSGGVRSEHDDGAKDARAKKRSSISFVRHAPASPLVVSCERGYVDVFRAILGMLLSEGVDRSSFLCCAVARQEEGTEEVTAAAQQENDDAALGWNLLHVACAHRRPACVQALLSLFSDDVDAQFALLNAEDAYGRTPLHLACGWPIRPSRLFCRDRGRLSAWRDDATVRAVISSLGPGFAPSKWRDTICCPDGAGFTCLHYACMTGNFAALKVVVERDGTACPAFEPCRLGYGLYRSTLFHCVSDGGLRKEVQGLGPCGAAFVNEFLRYMLDRTCRLSADVEPFLSPRTTFLHRCAALTTALNGRDADGNTPLHAVCVRGDDTTLRAMVDVIESTYSSPSSVVYDVDDIATIRDDAGACLRSCRRAAREDYVVDLDAVNAFNFTPLHEACQHGHVGCVRVLLEYARRLSIRRTEGFSKTRPFLNIDVNAKDEVGCAPLHLAAENGHVDVVEALLDSGAGVDVNARTHGSSCSKWNDVFTPADHASRAGYDDIVQLLAQYGGC